MPCTIKFSRMDILDYKGKNELVSSSLQVTCFPSPFDIFSSNTEKTVYTVCGVQSIWIQGTRLDASSCNILTPLRFTLYKVGTAVQG